MVNERVSSYLPHDTIRVLQGNGFLYLQSCNPPRGLAIQPTLIIEVLWQPGDRIHCFVYSVGSVPFPDPVSGRSSFIILEPGGYVYLVDYVQPCGHSNSTPGWPYPKVPGLAAVSPVMVVVAFIPTHASFLGKQLNQWSAFRQVVVVGAREFALFYQLRIGKLQEKLHKGTVQTV